MIQGLLRKARQVANDPVLRRWMVARALGRMPGEPPFTAHRPPYAAALLPLPEETPVWAGPVAMPPSPAGPISLPLPGLDVALLPGDEAEVFRKPPADIEALLALHRFAWLPLLGEAADPAWVAALWRCWRTQFGDARSGWAWHPYTAAERAINLLGFARCHGLPGPADDTLAVLAAHGPAIAAQLEWFGDHHTSNHCANNGRGLYLLGLELGLARAAELGAAVLLNEADRIFLPSGVLREGSSHYHLLLTRSYLECALAARRHGRPEAAALEQIARAALAVLPCFALPGGLPLIGDISPDCPPEWLDGLLPGRRGGGWMASLSEDQRAWVESLRGTADPSVDGWIRRDHGDWALLVHASPEGWCHMPGHGHQDFGSFALHWGALPVIVDAGRGSYEDRPQARLDVSGRAHSILRVDGADPFPANKPYFSADFRRAVCGGAPIIAPDDTGITVAHCGFSRLGGVGRATRRFTFAGKALRVEDRVEGHGRRIIERRLVTALAVEGDTLCAPTARFRLVTDAAIRVEPATLWTAYGRSHPGTCIVLTGRAALPWSGRFAIEALPCAG